jgi:hypothetical protein
MNFCKECDEYISLYIDELLDDKTKSDFLKHINKCRHCSAKFEEALYCAELCKEEQDIQLPEYFSEALHLRLQEVSESSNKKNKQEKLILIIKSKRFVASLSTAAVLVISLLAYNLMPNMVTKNDSTANYTEAAQIENKKAEDIDNSGKFSGSSEVEKNIQDQASGESNLSSAKDTEDVAAGIPSEDKDIKITLSEPIPTEKKENDVTDNNVNRRTFEGEEVVGSESGNQDAQTQNDALLYSISGNDPDTAKYISNYSEIKMEVSAQRKEIGQLKLLMNDIGASELHTFSDNNIDENMNSAEDSDKADSNTSTYESANSFIIASEYVDYYLPLNQYSLLETRAEKYHLEFNSKTDIIKKDISQIYNELNEKKAEIDNKITKASKNKEDTSAYEVEKERLTEEMNKIINEKEIVIVRIFFVLS